MLASVDGKISTGATDELDVDRDFPLIPGVAEGVGQYYEIEQTTDLWSLNSGRVQAKMGVNEKPMPGKSPVSFVLLDNSHLSEHGVRYFSALSNKFVLVTSNKHHPAFSVAADNLFIIYQEQPSLAGALERLCSDFGCERLTVQSGGTLNAEFLRAGLIDYVDIVVAPIMIGGKDTSSIVDGESIRSRDELSRLSAMRLIECKALEDSYVRLKYEVINKESQGKER